MADIVRCAGQAFVERSRRWINWQHRKVLLAIATAAPAADIRPPSPATRSGRGIVPASPAACHSARIASIGLTVLSQDIFTVDPSELPKTESVMTMVGGKIVYDGNVLPH